MIKIFVAEDEAKSRNALVSRLRHILNGECLIEAVSDGNEAVLKAVQVQPDLIFMDIEMPLKNGLEAAAVIRQQLPETRIVFLTAYDRFDYAVGAVRVGANDYLLKPVSDADLRELIQEIFDISPEPVSGLSPFETTLHVWVYQHYAEEVTLNDVAESMGMSTFYFSRQMKAVMGKTFLEFLTAYRIEKAKKRLLSTELSVSDIGRSVGYLDSNYFTKVFKRATGVTPSVYRTIKSSE